MGKPRGGWFSEWRAAVSPLSIRRIDRLGSVDGARASHVDTAFARLRTSRTNWMNWTSTTPTSPAAVH
ncbi:hypothetical protein BOC51_11365 [Burkholderia pseudomallei]|uniref:Uncharacterized protein n=1 Tax=Burkholderia pseudomallei 1710a TaxID=320371 RepID=A0A0E1W9C6_BURPE|nr:hypothetical protein BOC51_11365 [Burkholderia pseudomallei]EET08921.1 hypothetical protein BURPS1710A_0339 [Burkholderia pseudomallei 1710a]